MVIVGEMEFEEIFTSPFTTPTTCYSCTSTRKRNIGVSNKASNTDASNNQSLTTKIQFATENHILGVEIPENNADSNDDVVNVKTSCCFLPRDSAQLTCVGYAHWEEEEEKSEIDKTMKVSSERPEEVIHTSSDFTTVCRIQAIALIDPALIEEHLLPDHESSSPSSSSTAVNLHRPSPAIIDKDDAASVVTVTTNAEGRPQPKHNRLHRRDPSSTSASSIISGTVATTTNPPLSSGGGGSYHRKSQSELSISRGSHTTTSDTQQSYHTNNNKNNNDSTSEKNQNKKSLLMQKSKARLVLRQDQYSVRQSTLLSGGECKENKNKDNQEYYDRQQHESSSLALLDFRPLCPCVARWGQGQARSNNNNNNNQVNNNNIIINNNNNENDGFVGVWLGSADDATLRLYVPSSNDPRSLVSVALPEEHFSVDSPVMALAFCSVRWQEDDTERGKHGSSSNSNNNIENNNPAMPTATATTTHTLAVACQDGTIQLITWKDPIQDEDNTNIHLFADVTSEKVIVDGPLVCLKLDYNQHASLRLIVGSLCGYVCQLTYSYNHHREGGGDSVWEGPFMVVQDLWNSSIKTEESVLAVDVWENYVAVGTQLGRCLLYATHDSENYFPVWQAILPYSVHGITIINRKGATANTTAAATSEKEGKCSMTMSLAVTTRRSFHVFEAVQEGVAWRRKPTRERYSAELGRTRLLKILQGIRNENEESDLITRKFVHETIQNLLAKVEETVQMHNIDDSVSSNQEDVATIIAANISDLLDRVEEHIAAENTTTSPTQLNSYNLELEEKVMAIPAADPPQWEYSSSDEDVSVAESERNNADDQAAPRLATEPIEEIAVDDHVEENNL